MNYMEKTSIVQNSMFYGQLLIGNSTIILCAFILYVTWRMTATDGDYRFLVGGLAVINGVGGLLTGGLQPIFTINGPFNGALCSALGFASAIPLLWGAYFNVVLAFSRMLGLYHPATYQQCFQKRHCVIYTAVTGFGACLTIFLISNYGGVAFGWGVVEPVTVGTDPIHEFTTNLSESALSYLFRCGVIRTHDMSLSIVAYALCTFSCTAASCIFVYLVYKKLRAQRAMMETLTDAQIERLKENRNLIIFALLQGLSPILLFSVPQSIVILSLAFKFELYPTLALLYLPVFFNTTSDTILTIVVLKHYRNAFLRVTKLLFAKLRPGCITSGVVTPVAHIEMAPLEFGGHV